MTFIKKLISVLLSISLLISALFIQFSFNAFAASQKGVVININDALNIRSQPSKSGSKLGKIYNGYNVTVNSETTGDTVTDNEINGSPSSNKWYNITYNGITGYVSSLYISIIPEYVQDNTFEAQISTFPDSYKPYLRELHAQYPNWEFIADNVNVDFYTAVAAQSVNMKKQVHLSYHPVSWRSMTKGSYDWDKQEWMDQNGGWTGASKEIIGYYMDPRNFLNSGEVYMFLMQSYGNATYTASELKSIVSGCFLDTDEYINLILKAGKESGVSPYVIASKIRQEQGVNGDSDLISGNYTGANGQYKGYYNFFNWGASGSTGTAVIENGLRTAQLNGWNTKEKSIVEGAKKLAVDYIGIGQDTYYYQDFNVKNNATHQFAQAVHDARSKGTSLQKHYGDKTDVALTFKIPVFNNMPASAHFKPREDDTHNNYYFDNISVSGLTDSFYRFTYNYNLYVTGDTIVDVSIPSTAYINCELQFPLQKGYNNVVLRVRSQSGYTNDYTITVNAAENCTLYIHKGDAKVWGIDTTEKIKGDINGDGNITVSDMATIRLHLLNKYTISGDLFSLADVNGDGVITVSDMATIRLHLLGKYTIR